MKYRMRKAGWFEYVIEAAGPSYIEESTFMPGLAVTVQNWSVTSRFWTKRNTIIHCTKLALEGHEVDFQGHV